MAKLTFGSGSQAEVPGQSSASSAPGARASRGSAVPGAPGSPGTRGASGASGVPGAESAPAAGVPGQPGAAGEGRGAGRGRKRSDEQVSSVFGSADAQADFGPDYSYRRIRFHKNDEVNPYAAEQDARYGMDERLSKLIMLGAALLVIFFLVCILPTNLFDPATRTDHTIGSLAGEVASSFKGLISFFTGADTMFSTYVFTVIVTLLAGAAMGLSGGVFQGAMKNALASPSTLGVTSGGTIGVIIYAVFVAPHTIGATFQGQISEYSQLVAQMTPLQYALELFGTFLSSLIGCVLIVFLVMAIALIAGKGRVSNASLIIAGQVFTAAIGVFITLIKDYLTIHADAELLTVLQNAQTSTFTGAYNLMTVSVFAVPLIACMVVIVLMAPRLTLLAFNDDEARSMGISTTATRNVMVAVCTVMTALVVSFCGAVGFVGFMVPHIARRLIGPDFRYLLPACALMGAGMVCVTFYISQLGIPWIASGSTGVITSVVGCAMFLFMALRNRGAASGDWL